MKPKVKSFQKSNFRTVQNYSITKIESLLPL